MLRSGAGWLTTRRISGSRQRRKVLIFNIGDFIILGGRRGSTTESEIDRFAGMQSGREIVAGLGIDRSLRFTNRFGSGGVEIADRVALLGTGCARESNVSHSRLRLVNAGSGRLGAASEVGLMGVTGL